jgi:tRNA(adenine34) deaminase
MTGEEIDTMHLRRAIELGDEAAALGEVPVGAVLVLGDMRVESKNAKETTPDATAHAEILALREACRRLGTWRLTGATLYVTKEPCVMCAGALLAARVSRLVYGANDPKGGADGGAFDILRSKRTNHRIDVVAGLLQRETGEQLQRFFATKRGAEAGAPGTP